MAALTGELDQSELQTAARNVVVAEVTFWGKESRPRLFRRIPEDYASIDTYNALRRATPRATLGRHRLAGIIVQMVASVDNKLDVFVSYSHADETWLKRVQVHLRPLIRDKRIDLWDDTRMKAGQRWREEIGQALARAKVAVLLISADFYASDFIASNELPPLLDAERKRGLVILGVHISRSRFDRAKSSRAIRASTHLAGQSKD